MRLKTFIATYLLFLFILFTSVGIVSVYLTNSQIDMLKEKSIGQYQTIVHSLTRDITGIRDRGDQLSETEFSMAVDDLVRGYARYYSRHNINIAITNLTLSEQDNRLDQTEASFTSQEDGYYIQIIGAMPEPFEHFLLDYSLDITENIADMRNIQSTLLISVAIFSVIAAFALYFILSSIFKPLAIVAKASGKIADGQFGERINIKGKNEIAKMAFDFNKMAERIENQITYLEEEAVSKQQFVDNFAHEIRTPLTSIYGYAEYLQKTSLDESEIIESTGHIMDQSIHMKNMANSLLQLATLRSYIPIKDEISISALFDDIKHTMEQSLRDNNVELVCNVVPRNDVDTDIVIYGQEDLIKSLLLNLCSNALKACSEGEGKICLEAKEGLEGTVVICVTDNGVGIPEESLADITEPFYRVDKSRSREHGGTGLGLTLCQQIVEVHNAKMTVKSASGLGTIVEVEFNKFLTTQ